MRIVMSSKTLVNSCISMKIPKSTHLVPVVRKGSQASFKGMHCTTVTTLMAMHQTKHNINTMSFARLLFRVVKIDAYQVSMETLASVMPHM